LHPNLGAALVVVIGLVLVFVAVKGSQNTFFGSFLGSKPSTSSSNSGAAAANSASPVTSTGGLTPYGAAQGVKTA
jgi:hypothetical protein